MKPKIPGFDAVFKEDKSSVLSSSSMLKDQSIFKLEEQKPSSQAPANGDLLDSLLQVFNGEEAINLNYLSDDEFKLFLFIVFRKSLAHGDEKKIPSKKEGWLELVKLWAQKKFDRINTRIKKDLSENNPRRHSEKVKFIFRKVLKLHKDNYYSKHEEDKKMKARAKEQKYWEYYFSQYCDEKGIPLTDVMYPNPEESNKESKKERINDDYLKKLFNNNNYKRCLLIIVDVIMNWCSSDYYVELKRKLEKFIDIGSEKINDISIDNVENIIKLSKLRKFKSPLTVFDIKDCVQVFKVKINKILND